MGPVQVAHSAMHLCINGRFLSQRVTGVQRYARELVWGLDRLMAEAGWNSPNVTVELLIPSGIDEIPDYQHIQTRVVGKFQGHLWEQWDLPRAVGKEVLLNLGNTAPLFKRRQAVTIHDVSVYTVPEAYSKAFRIWYKLQFSALSRRLPQLITVSKFSKEEMVHYLPAVTPEKITVTYEGREHMDAIASDNSILNNPELKGKNYILAVSSLSPHKNFGAVVKALDYLKDLPELSVVIIGGGNQQVFSQINLSENAQVIRPGYVTDSQLKALYEHAMGFIHASLYEGFGLPPLEAMSCGCPVIVSHAAAIPEVCGDAALYFDPHNPQEIAQQIRRLVADDELRSQLKEKAIAQAAKFSWRQCALETLAVLASINAQ